MGNGDISSEKTKKLKSVLAVYMAVSNIFLVVLICFSVWHSYCLDKSKQLVIVRSEEQYQKQFESDEKLLYIVNYKVFPATALWLGFSAYALFRLRK